MWNHHSNSNSKIKWNELNKSQIYQFELTKQIIYIDWHWEYNKLLTENVSENFKTTDKSSLNRINTEVKNVAKDLKLDERIEKHSQQQ